MAMPTLAVRLAAKTKRIVVFGGGFAGLSAAQRASPEASPQPKVKQ
jgi:NADH dehydrogenase FAD-containing subunit